MNREDALPVVALALDPIEKKPLARFHPGSRILSVGSYGCTLHCPWCQNHDIACPKNIDALDARLTTPSQLADLAKRYIRKGNIGLAYTYNEPLYRWKSVLACAKEIHTRGLLNVLVTNGMASDKVIDQLFPLIDATNIDLKAFTQEGYDVCGGRLTTVLHCIERACELGVHVEVTTLIIPGFNDDVQNIEKGAQTLAAIDSHLTWHLTRFFPRYKWKDKDPTPISTLIACQNAAQLHLEDVILGNV